MAFEMADGLFTGKLGGVRESYCLPEYITNGCNKNIDSSFNLVYAGNTMHLYSFQRIIPNNQLQDLL
jgi:hypothetical protein